MKRSLFHSGILLFGSSGMLVANSEPQQQVSFTEGASSTWNADWSGLTSRTYFLQWSLDLVNWNYAPLVEFGTGLKSSGINTQGEEKFFVRLHYIDDTGVTTLQQARDADFDNDGIPNYYELENLFTNPLDKNSAGGDSDTDGLPDGWELFHFGSLVATPGAIGFPLPSGDGLTNKEKADLGLNPNTDYSATTAGQPASYTYDPVGRLTGVTAPVGAGTYTPDQEGNLLNAQ
jgi:YD repeat-containing protein